MKVRELIAALQALDPDLPVLVDGYEGGQQPPEPPLVMRAWRYRDGAPSYCGGWEVAWSRVEPDEGQDPRFRGPTLAVVLGRYRRCPRCGASVAHGRCVDCGPGCTCPECTADQPPPPERQPTKPEQACAQEPCVAQDSELGPCSGLTRIVDSWPDGEGGDAPVWACEAHADRVRL